MLVAICGHISSDTHSSKRRLNWMAKYLLILLVSLTSSSAQAEKKDQHFLFKLGTLSAVSSDAFPKSTSSSSLIVLGWQSIGTNTAASFEMNRANDTASDRTLYQSFVMNYAWYFRNTPVPQTHKLGHRLIEYDYSLAPFIQGGLAIGHILLEVVGNSQAFEASSDFYAPRFTVGTLWKAATDFALEISLAYEIATGINSPWSYSGTNTLINLGLHYHL